MKSARVAIAVIAAGGFAFVGWRMLRSAEPDPGSQLAATSLASGFISGISAAASLVEPYPCARISTLMTDHELRLEPSVTGSFSLGVVADARGVVEYLPRIRERFADKAVDLVVSLGGMGHTEKDIEAALTALTGPWRLLSVPGDRESSSAHERVCARLPHVLSGSSVRLIRAGNIATLLTFPGAPSQRRLTAGDDGCMYTSDDARQLAANFATPPDASEHPTTVRVLLSHTPPRQRGPDASDRTAAGVHIGDLALERAVEEAGISLALHGLEAQTDVSLEGSASLSSTRPVILGVGSADGLPDVTRDGTWPPLAMLVTITPESVTWEYREK